MAPPLSHLLNFVFYLCQLRLAETFADIRLTWALLRVSLPGSLMSFTSLCHLFSLFLQVTRLLLVLTHWSDPPLAYCLPHFPVPLANMWCCPFPFLLGCLPFLDFHSVYALVVFFPFLAVLGIQSSTPECRQKYTWAIATVIHCFLLPKAVSSPDPSLAACFIPPFLGVTTLNQLFPLCSRVYLQLWPLLLHPRPLWTCHPVVLQEGIFIIPF